jgi:hypothetical protein
MSWFGREEEVADEREARPAPAVAEAPRRVAVVA